MIYKMAGEVGCMFFTHLRYTFGRLKPPYETLMPCVRIVHDNNVILHVRLLGSVSESPLEAFFAAYSRKIAG